MDLLSVIPPEEIWVAIPKVIEIFFFVLIAIGVKNRGGRSYKDQYYLNRTFFFAFLSWVFYITCDLFIFLFAAVSFDPTVPITAVGYDLGHPSLLVANILRDIGLTGGLLNAIFLLIAAMQIRYGEKETKRKVTRNPISIIVIVAFLVIGGAFDMIKVQIGSNGNVSINPYYASVTIITLSTAVGVYFAAAFALRSSLYYNIKEAPPLLRRRLRLLSFGVLLMGVGEAYWILKGVLNLVPAFTVFITTNDLWLKIAGHCIWILSPVLIYLGLRELPVEFPEKAKSTPLNASSRNI
ncbi:MAG TPA: hypothetical protein VKK79_19470 [Candidatus Lokiarchaeia archaeon]|nr:hypothetical protein [Candidatus Lokiarchaeia archaeon]